jgi:tRNA threonylcarbamoyladenosine biosynthesis protein TsaB
MSNSATEIPQQEDTPPIILAIETATRAGSVAVSRGNHILSCVTGDASSSHSTDLIDNIDRVLREGGLRLSDVDLFAVAIGPGSFTGLRIGLATTKSLAVAMDKKCVGVSTLGAIALAAGESGRSIALLPAGRGEVFAQMFSVIGDGVTAFDEAMHISPRALLLKYGGHDKIRWAGEGAHAQLELLRDAATGRGLEFGLVTNVNGSGWSVAVENGRIAESVARLAAREYRDGRIIKPEELRADYVRPSDAEIKTHA